jgi:hypothetical protein
MIEMPRLTLDLDLEQLKAILFQLPAEDLVELAEAIAQRAETLAMMEIAESGFSEWNEEGEDIYDADA